jgi:ParB family chromosome partitioning protein
VAKKGLPTGITMRHDAHYVEELTRAHRTIGRIIAINQIEPNPEQPRVEIGDLTDLTSSIKEKGILEPLLVKPVRETGTWMIIAGERRWRAANLAGLQEVPCIELDIDEKSIAEIALIENLQRKDLTVWEEADGLADLANRYGYTHDEIAKKIGKSRSTVTEAMAIAGLPDNIRRRCLDTKINSKSTLLEISRQFDAEAMNQLLDNIQSNNLKRQEIRQASRPQAVRSQVHQTNERNSALPSPSKNFAAPNISDEKSADIFSGKKDSFKYVSKTGKFEVEIKFRGNLNPTIADLSEALEEAISHLQNLS